MQKFNAKALLSEFSKLSSSDKNKKAHSNKVIKQETKMFWKIRKLHYTIKTGNMR